jgi:hypothetical protein
MVQGFSPVAPLKKLPQMRVAVTSTVIQDAISRETKEKIDRHTREGVSIKVPPSWSEAFFALGVIWVTTEKILMKHDPTLACCSL